MNLIRVHLKEGDSLGILNNFTHEFTAPASNAVEPLCLVGQNGTGKSRLLQCLAEIFYDLDHRCRHGKEDGEYPVTFTYELEYELKTPRGPLRVLVNKSSPKAKPKLERRNGEKWEEVKLSAELLPDRIIGYTSGQNETLSWPFLELRDEYSKAVSEAALEKDAEPFENLPQLRLEMVDYNLNLAVLCAVFLTKSKGDADAFSELAELTRIEDLESLRFVVRLHHQAAKKIGGVKLTEQHIRYLENFKKCATCWDFNKAAQVWTFDFMVLDETRRAIGRYFASTWALFAAFQRLEMLNYLMVDKHIRLDHAKERRRRKLSTPAPQPAEPEKVFVFQEVCLRLAATREPVDYINLSDGEHQFAHIFGTLIMFREGNVLYLLDEPESHFNPKWRIEFVRFVNKCLKPQHGGHALLMTTHAPFVLSDCRRENVYIFERSTDRATVKIRRPLFETYGTSFDWLLEQIFRVKPPIAKKALAELDALREEKDPIKIEQKLKTLGDSTERLHVIEHLQDLKSAQV